MTMQAPSPCCISVKSPQESYPILVELKIFAVSAVRAARPELALLMTVLLIVAPPVVGTSNVPSLLTLKDAASFGGTDEGGNYHCQGSEPHRFDLEVNICS